MIQVGNGLISNYPKETSGMIIVPLTIPKLINIKISIAKSDYSEYYGLRRSWHLALSKYGMLMLTLSL